MKRMLLILFSLVLVLSAGLSVARAQTRDDRDGDGIPNSVDNCPDQAGPRENGGCPLPGGGSVDRDGDGVADFVDLCPDQPGTGFTEGCPEDTTQPQPNAPSPIITTFRLPPLPETGACVLATRSALRINIRAEASTQSPIVGLLDPSLTYPVIVVLEQKGGNWLRIAEGWVAEWVVHMGGACASLPAVQIGTLLFDSNPGPPNSPLAVISPNPQTPETLLASFRDHPKPVELSRFLFGSPEINPNDNGDCGNADGGSFAYGGGFASSPCDQSDDCGEGGTLAYGGGSFASDPCDRTDDCGEGGTFAYGGGSFASDPCDQSDDCGNDQSMNWSSGETSVQMSYGGTSIGDTVLNETVPCVRSALDGHGVVIRNGNLRYLLHFYAGMDTSVTPNELFILGVVEPSDGTGAIYPEFTTLVDPNSPTTIHFDIGVDPETQAIFLSWSSSANTEGASVQPGPPNVESNPGPPNNPAEQQPGPPTIDTIVIKPGGGESADRGYIIGALWNDPAGGVNEIVLDDMPGSEIMQIKWFIDQSLVVKPA